MEQNIDLLCAEVLNKSNPDYDLSFNLSKKASPKDATPVSTEADLSQEVVRDSISNRNQREKFTKQIISIMCYELIFIAFLISIVLFVQFFNALAPKITMNLPPIFISLLLFISYAYLSKYSECLPDVRISSKALNFKKHTFSLTQIIKPILLVMLIIILSCLPREKHIIYYNLIDLTPDIVHMILYTALAVFVKTTFLASYIIKGLYDALNKKDRPKETFKNFLIKQNENR